MSWSDDETIVLRQIAELPLLLQRVIAGGTLENIRTPPFKLENHSEIAAQVETICTTRKDLEICLFSTTGWAFGTEMMADRSWRERELVCGMEMLPPRF